MSQSPRSCSSRASSTPSVPTCSSGISCARSRVVVTCSTRSRPPVPSCSRSCSRTRSRPRRRRSDMMAVSNKHVLQQGPVLATHGRAALTVFRQSLDARLGRPAPSGMPPIPSAEIHETILPRPNDLVRDYVRNVGGDPSAYKGIVPPHLFPQWGFPLQARTLEGLPYPLVRVLNGGCRLEMNAPLPADQPLE